MHLEDPLDILPQAADKLQGGDTAVADGRIHIVQALIGQALENAGQVFLRRQFLQAHAGALDLRLEGSPAPGDVLIPALPLEPLADLTAGLAGAGDLHPVPAGAVGGLGGDDLHNISVFQLGIKLGDMSVDLGGNHVVAHGGVDAVRKVDGGGAGRQVDDIPLRGEDKHLIGKHIHLQRVDELLRVGAVLVLQQAAHPLIILLVAGALAVLLILPMGGNAVFGDLVHLPGADLHLEGNTVIPYHGGVEGLVHIGLGSADIVLEPSQHRLIQIVDDPQHMVALGHGVDDDPESKKVEHIVQGFVLGVHLAVDAVRVLHAAGHGAVDICLLQAGGDLVVDRSHKPVVLRGLFLQCLNDLLIADRVQILKAQVLQLPFQLLHTQAVGNGGVDLHGLQRFLLLLLRRLILHGAHIVQPVRHFDEDDTDVLAHGQKHLAQILHLLLRLGGCLHTGQLADALHNIGYGRRKASGYILMSGRCVLDGVVEQGGGNGFRIQMQLLRHDLCHSQRVGNKGRSVLAVLPPMMLLGKAKGRADQVQIGAGVILADGILQPLVLFLHIHCFSPHFPLIYSCSAIQ